VSAVLDASHNLELPAPQPAPSPAPCCCNGARWTVVTVWPQADRYAASNLRRQGYVAFLPLTTVTRRDRALPTLRHRVEVPLFSGYLFVQHDPRDSWTPIRTTPGVRSMLRNGNQLQYARAGAVEAVQAAAALAASTTQDDAQWAPGAAVALSAGPFASHPAVVLRVARETAHLSVMLFGALRQVSAPVAWLMARD
jgi:transcription antitermination factor NusG